MVINCTTTTSILHAVKKFKNVLKTVEHPSFYNLPKVEHSIQHRRALRTRGDRKSLAAARKRPNNRGWSSSSQRGKSLMSSASTTNNSLN